MLTAQTTWTGASGTAWNNAANWSADIPDAFDNVTIPDLANDPVIPGGVAAVAKSVTVNAGAVLTVQATASLSINSALNVGMLNQGTVENSGLISIGATASNGNTGLENQGTFNNKTGAELKIDRSLTYALLISGSGVFTNAAKLTFGSLNLIGNWGVFNQGAFTNNAGGDIRIDRANASGVTNQGTFTNNALITIGAVASVGTNGITNSGTFNNSSGTISIDQTTSSGIYNNGNFTNGATIAIGATASVGMTGLYNINSFQNNAGEIRIDRTSTNGLMNDGTFTNAAKILIGQNAAVGNRGIYVRFNSTFNNNTGSEIKIDRATSVSLLNEGTITNAAKIFIGQLAAAGGYGLHNNSSTFHNNTGGEIRIDRTTSFAWFNDGSGTCTNAAKITIGALSSVGITGIYCASNFTNNATGDIGVDGSSNTGIFLTNSNFINNGKVTVGAISGAGLTSIYPGTGLYNNNACAETSVFTPVNIGFLRFNNYGLFRVNTTGTHTSDAMNNNGIIEYPQGNPIPNVTNHDLIVKPFTTNCSAFAPALQLGFNNDFTAAGTWYSNPALTIPVGTYNQASNTFTWDAAPAAGVYTLYFAVTDDVNGCVRTVSVTVTVVIPEPANAGPDQTDAATCGLTQVTLAANTPTVGTGAWSIISGTGGSLGNAASPTSTFSGTAGTAYTLRWTISNAPCPASTDDVVITFNRNPTAANAGPDQTDAATCGLTQVTLAANTPTVGTGAWSIINGAGGSFGNAASPTSTFSGTAGTTYTLRWTISNAPCTASTDDVVITFNRNPTAANAGPDQTDAATCGLTQVTLAANMPPVGTGAWSIINGAGGSFGNAASPTSTFSGTAGTTYTLRWTISNAPCPASTDDVLITFNRNPTAANAGPDQTDAATCGLTQVTLVANTPSVGTGAWSIINGAGGSFGNTGSPISTFSGTAGTTYTLRWTISNAPCPASTDDVVITFNQNPVVSCPADLTVNSSDPTFALSGGSPSGGAYSGTGVNNGVFDPAIAGVGTHSINYVYTNGAGCSGSCGFMITVNSSEEPVQINGTVIWEQDGSSGVGSTIVTLSGDGSDTSTTPANGTYSLSATAGSNFTITPAKDINKLNGLSSADVTAIQKHVINTDPLPGPFKRIAADVNKSNSISTLDAVLVGQALLGNPAAMKLITSWRFVPDSYVFLNENIPWGFPENITLTGVSGTINGQDFKGIKLGDVVSTWANPANFNGGEPLVLRVQDQVLQAGQNLTVEFRADQLDDLNSFQFALYFPPDQLELIAIDPTPSGILTIDNFGTYNLAEGELRTVWAQGNSIRLEESTPLFSLRFKALQSGSRLREVLQLNEAVLPAHAYNSAYAESGVALHFSETTSVEPMIVENPGVLLVRPNPFTTSTTIQFELTKAERVQLEVFDLLGRRVRILQAAILATGVYEQYWDGKSDAGQALESGLYLIRLQAGESVLTKLVSLAR